MAALIVGFLGGSVLNVDLYGVGKKEGATSGFGLKMMILGSLCVSGPLHSIYLVELYPSYPSITILISSQLHTYGGQFCMSCISGGTSCRLPVRLSSEG